MNKKMMINKIFRKGITVILTVVMAIPLSLFTNITAKAESIPDWDYTRCSVTYSEDGTSVTSIKIVYKYCDTSSAQQHDYHNIILSKISSSQFMTQHCYGSTSTVKKWSAFDPNAFYSNAAVSDNGWVNLALNHNISGTIELTDQSVLSKIDVNSTYTAYLLCSYAGSDGRGGTFYTGISIGNIRLSESDNFRYSAKFDYLGHGPKDQNFTLPIKSGVSINGSAVGTNKDYGKMSIFARDAIDDWEELVEDPSDADYEFGGWYTEDTFENEVNFDTPVYMPLNIYAKWIGDEEMFEEPDVYGYENTVLIKNTVSSNTYGLYSAKSDDETGALIRPFTSPVNGRVTFTGLNPDTRYFVVQRASDKSVSEPIPVTTFHHDHSWTFDDSRRLVASCETEDPGICEFHDTDVVLSIDITEGAYSKNSSITIKGTEQWRELGLPEYTIKYKDVEDAKAEETDAAPTEPGTYRIYLSITYDGEVYTISKKFVITEENQIENNDDPDEIMSPTGLPEPKDTGLGTIEGISYKYGYIDYEERAQNRVYATDSKGEVVEHTYIDFYEEKLVTDLEYDAYSIDGGKNYKKTSTAITDKQMVTFINKKATLILVKGYDKKTRKPSENAIVYRFNKIEKRPKVDTLTVNYSKFADKYGVTNGQWGLVYKNGELANLSKIEIGEGSSKGNAIGENGYGIWPKAGGVWVEDLHNNKQVKTKYFYRILSYGTAPASKPKKIMVQGVLKAPKIKVNYKTETIKLSKGMSVYFGDAMPEVPDEEEKLELFDPETVKYSFLDYDTFNFATASFEAISGSGINGITTDQAKKKLCLSNYITTERNTIFIWKDATAKKPASEKQEIKLAKRYVLDKEKTLSIKVGVIKSPKGYQFYLEDKQKWVASIPKVKEDCVIRARLKATAKGGKENDTTYANGEECYIVIKAGEPEDTVKIGAISAVMMNKTDYEKYLKNNPEKKDDK